MGYDDNFLSYFIQQSLKITIYSNKEKFSEFKREEFEGILLIVLTFGVRNEFGWQLLTFSERNASQILGGLSRKTIKEEAREKVPYFPLQS